jgi:hypothetical protein
MNAIWYWIEYYKYAIGPASIIVGAFLFFTQQQSSPQIKLITFSLITMITIVSLTYLFIYVFISFEDTRLWIGWAVFGASVAISLPFCYLTYKFIRFGAILVGMASGTALALVL